MADTLSNSACLALDLATLNRCRTELVLARRQLQEQQRQLRSMALRGGKS